jgi:predicted nucleic acid-binding protein
VRLGGWPSASAGKQSPGKPSAGKKEKQGGMSGITFDAGGLIALDRNDRRVIALLARAADLGLRVTVPATALAQAIRNPARQARLSRLIRQASTDLVPLNGPDATAVGRLLAETATADIVDAHVAICAQRTGQAIVTSDPGDIRRIDPKLRLIAI